MHILYILALIILAFWLLGAILHVAGSMIHLLLVLAAILIVWRLLTGGRGSTTI
jgi:hypothetical protein